MDYSELVDALGKNNTTKINSILRNITPRLVRFLQIHMDAEKQDAEDCAQQALINALEAIEEERVRDSDRIFSFMLTSCRNNYLNLLKKNEKNLYEHSPSTYAHAPRQLTSLLDKERKKVLEWCMEHLSDDYKKFIDYWFRYPDTDARAVATRFDISVSNAWIRKHRIIKKLNECYEKKIEL